MHHEAMRIGLPGFKDLELFSPSRVLSHLDTEETQVRFHERLFFCDPSDPDPFPGASSALTLDPMG